MNITIREVTHADRPAFAEKIRALELGTSYPLGTDRFELDHGDDYFAFFDRLGAVSTFIALDGARVVAVGTGVLRSIRTSATPTGAAAWYVCDLKVAPDHRRRRIPFRMLLRALASKYPQCRRGYGVTMTPTRGEINPIVRFAGRVRVIASAIGTHLDLYSMDEATMQRCAAVVEAAYGPISYLSLRGRKDIVLHSTGQAMPLLHVQHGPCAEVGLTAPQPGHVHMLCVPSNGHLASALRDAAVEPTAYASVIQHNMADWDWSFVLTSDI